MTTLTAAESALLVLAGLGAGFVNGVAGGGSLVYLTHPKTCHVALPLVD